MPARRQAAMWSGLASWGLRLEQELPLRAGMGLRRALLRGSYRSSARTGARISADSHNRRAADFSRRRKTTASVSSCLPGLKSGARREVWSVSMMRRSTAGNLAQAQTTNWHVFPTTQDPGRKTQDLFSSGACRSAKSNRLRTCSNWRGTYFQGNGSVVIRS